MNLDVSQGSIADLGKDGVVVAKSAATCNGWQLGDTVPAEFAATGKHDLQVVGIYDGKGWIGDDFILSIDQQNAFAGPQLVSTGLVTLDRARTWARSRTPIAAALADHPDAKVLDQEGTRRRPAGSSTSCSPS